MVCGSMRDFYVTYDEAQKLIPVFKSIRDFGPYKEARDSGGRILRDLQFVRPLDYGVAKGHQLMLHDRDYEFFTEVLDQVKRSG